MKDFLSEQSVGNRFLLFCLFIRQKTAKRDKKTVCFTKSLQSTYHKWQKKYTAGAKAPAVCRIVRGCNFVQHQTFLKIELIKNYMLSLYSLRRCSIPQGFCRFSMQEIFRFCKKAGCRLRRIQINPLQEIGKYPCNSIDVQLYLCCNPIPARSQQAKI